MAMSNGRIAVAAVAAVAIGLVATYALTLRSGEDAFANCRASKVSGAVTIGGPFTLTDEDGKRVTDRDVLAKPSLVYFGYTSCPDICPTDAARNAEAVDALEEQGYDVTPVFISVDPKRDTPAVLKEWTDYIHPRMVGLTGTPDELKKVAAEYRTIFQVPDNPTEENYPVNHMTQTYLMLPNAGFEEFFASDATAADVADRTACFIEAAKAAN